MIMGAAIASIFWIAALPLIRRRGAADHGAHDPDDRRE